MFVSTTFDRVSGYAIAKVACRECGAVKEQNVREECTINPFNRNEQGDVCSREEVREQARQSAQRSAQLLVGKGRICYKCEQKAAPPYEHENLPSDAFDAAAVALKQIETLNKSLRESLASCRGKDIMISGRRAQIQEVYLQSDYSPSYISIGYRFYSKSKTALPGELLVDTHYTHADRITFI